MSIWRNIAFCAVVLVLVFGTVIGLIAAAYYLVDKI